MQHRPTVGFPKPSLGTRCAAGLAILCAALTNVWPRGRDLRASVLGAGECNEVPNERLRGIFVTVLTPLTEELNIDQAALRAQVEYLLRSGVHGLLLLGSIGEGPYLTTGQREAVLKTVADVVGDQLPVVVGVTSLSTVQAVEHARQAARYGADALTVALPICYQIPFPQLKEHVVAVAESVELPVLFYYYPEAYGGALSPRQVADILKHPRVVGVKESILDIAHIERQIRACADPSKIFWAGTTVAMPEVMELGGDGAASVVGLFMPRTAVALYDAVRRGDRTEIERIRARLFQALPLLKPDSPPSVIAHAGFLAALRGQIPLTLGTVSTHARLKLALQYRGIPIKPIVSPPLPPLTNAERRLVRTVMERINALEPVVEPNGGSGPGKESQP